jgi:hypothetical protein
MTSHVPDLSWEYSGLTTFDLPFQTSNNFVFRLKRLDGGFQIDLPREARSYSDSLALKNKKYTYSLQVITSSGDTSTTVLTDYSPAASVSQLQSANSFRAELSSNPLQIGSSSEIKIFANIHTTLTINIYSILGNKQETIALDKLLSPGENDFTISPKQAGCYFYEIISRTSNGEERSYGKFVVTQ